MDVRDFLQKLGLPQYEAAFRDNGIDLRVLPKLTAEDLKDLGVNLIGHRRLLLDAITALRNPPSAPVKAGADAPDVARVQDTRAASPTQAERRPLTVMFCDLVGSTALSSRLDPEDLREVIRTYQSCVANTIRQFDGFIARYVGDGVLIYLGWPEARETDAERAVRAGLAVAAAVSQAPVAGEPLQVRIGIATGLVVIGEAIGSGDSRQQTAVGETPNLAARLQGLAGPGQVVIDAATRRQIGGLFEYRDLGNVALKGFAEDVPVWQVLGVGLAEGRFEALHGTNTPLIGRDEEMELLFRRWAQAEAGSGRVVLISGEPGVGKSRLAEALAERIAAEPHVRLRYFCSPHHQESALYPVIAQMGRAALFEREDPLEKKLDKLEALLAPAAPPAEDVGLLAELLSLPAASRYPLPPSTPQRRREKTFEALLRQHEALARQSAILMVFEDLHWIDPSSRELLDRTIERVANLRILLVATFRPEFAPPWSGLPQATALTLARLDRRTGAAMVESIAGKAAMSSEVAAEIVERADGVPLFVEELTRAVLEVGGRGEGVEKTLAGAVSPSAAVPAALHAPLMARLDRLGQTPKEIAQIAAAIGREFSYELLAPVAKRGEAELRGALGRLTDAGLVFSRGAPPYATYLFKHALVRDAAYDSLLRRRREELHARIVAVLEADCAEAVAAEPELLARHLTEAGLFERAVPYWRRAGERATERSAYIEAIAHLKRGLEILKRLPESRERDEQELLLLAALTPPFSATEGYASAALERAARRGIELGGRIGGNSPAQLQAILARGWLADIHLVRGELPTGLALAEEFLDLAERKEDSLLLSLAHFSTGVLRLYLGDLAAARLDLKEALALYDPEHDPFKAPRYRFDMGCHASARLGLVLWHEGFPDEALRHSQEAIAAARAGSHPLGEALALSHAAKVHQLRGEARPCLERAEATLTLATEQVLPFYVARAEVLVGWARVKTDEAKEGLPRLRAGLDGYRAIGAKFEMPHWLALLAEACLAAGRIEEGLSAVREALAEVEETAARCYEAELNRLRGELQLAAEEPDESRAEYSFRKAIGIAGAQGAKSFELRAAASLARLLARQGRRGEARGLLAPVYAWFTEGFDTADLKKAKTLLDKLA